MYIYEIVDGEYEVYKNLSTAFRDAVKLLIEYNEKNKSVFFIKRNEQNTN